MRDVREILEAACGLAVDYRAGAQAGSPYASAGAQELEALFDVGLPEDGRPGVEIVKQLAAAAGPGLIGTTGDAFFGWVIGGSHPVGVAADWLAGAWGQNAATYQLSPAAAAAEQVAGGWLLDLLDLPAQASIGFTTGSTMAGFICLAAARSECLRLSGWDLERDGMFGAPEISVFVSCEAHSAVYSALRSLGFGMARLVVINADAQGCMCVDDLTVKLADRAGPKIIIGQAGHINSGAFDDFEALAALAKSHQAWLHIDGAFGLWARAAPDFAQLCHGAELADSWAVDGHKWLQVPYESGYAIVKNVEAHQRAMAHTASYLNEAPSDGRNPLNYVPELSRRARGFATWAVLQALGRAGVAALVNENCQAAQRVAQTLGGVPGINILNQVCLNQLVVSFGEDGQEQNALTLEIVAVLQQQRRWFVKEAKWYDRVVMRLSFSSGQVETTDLDALTDDIIAAWAKVRAGR